VTQKGGRLEFKNLHECKGKGGLSGGVRKKTMPMLQEEEGKNTAARSEEKKGTCKATQDDRERHLLGQKGNWVQNNVGVSYRNATS